MPSTFVAAASNSLVLSSQAVKDRSARQVNFFMGRARSKRQAAAQLREHGRGSPVSLVNGFSRAWYRGSHMRTTYKVLERLGGGGQAEVFRGVAETLQGFKKAVAIKRVLPNLTSNELFVRMF